MKRGVVFLLLALAARAGDDLDGLVRRLEHEDPAARRAAQAELLRIGAPAVRRVFPLIDSRDTEVRRFAHRLIGGQLRGGPPDVQRTILRLLVEQGRRAFGFVPDLEHVGRRYGGELGYLARVASMKIAGTRQHVRYLAAQADAYEILAAFDPERGPVLRATFRQWERQPRGARDLEKYLDLLARADAGAPEYLTQRVLTSEGEVLLLWLDVAGHLTRWPPELGVAFASRVRFDSGRILYAVLDTLLRGPRDWRPIAARLIEPVLGRVANNTGFTRGPLLLVAARCGPRDKRVGSLLERESKRTTATGLVALCALRAREPRAPDPVKRLAGLDEPARRGILTRLVLSGTDECAPVLLHRLRHGSEDERTIVLNAVESMPARTKMLPGLADVAELGPPAQVHRAVLAAARTDGRLAWHGTESIVLRGLTHTAAVVRSKSVYACDDLQRLTPKIVATLERLAEDREVATAMAWFLPNVRRLGRRAELMVPMLARIVQRGPSSGLIWGGKSAVRWRRECLRALTEIRPMHPLARDAFHAGIASSDRLTRLFALRGFRHLGRPEPKDYAAVKRAMDDKNEGVRRAAGVVLMSEGWERARQKWADPKGR